HHAIALLLILKLSSQSKSSQSWKSGRLERFGPLDAQPKDCPWDGYRRDMRKRDVLRAWGRILSGYYPMLSIEITRECPLRCPGCYAYEPQHLGDLGPLRTVSDYKGQALIDGVLSLVRRHRPIHVSIVGGEPLVRFRELNSILPVLSGMGIEVQLVT